MSENLVIEIEFHAVVLTSFHPFAYNLEKCKNAPVSSWKSVNFDGIPHSFRVKVVNLKPEA